MRKEEQMKLYTFQSYIAESLCKRGRPSSSIAAEYEGTRGEEKQAIHPFQSPDATDHWMAMDEKTKS
ncbi:Hypothetical protein SMAX5B_007920 [Scophthalmus maximus]|uniref:Uncharacterized protein n=1 Tax=Scophthalmus maximus TaxID=52904 RepID=A0A2U9C5N6_SCOMX|nr:Hypothetical protein SMAX5B_007920 [Scophthalmus maximus]